MDTFRGYKNLFSENKIRPVLPYWVTSTGPTKNTHYHPMIFSLNFSIDFDFFILFPFLAYSFYTLNTVFRKYLFILMVAISSHLTCDLNDVVENDLRK